MNWQRLRRSIIALLAVTALITAGAAITLRAPGVRAAIAYLPIGPNLDPTPLPPIIAAPAGPLPAGPAGLTELAQYGEQGYQGAGSGFFLRLPNSLEIGVTTAHSVTALGQPGNNLQHIAFALPGMADPATEFQDLYGRPGAPFSGADLSVDYMLLRPPGPVDAARVQDPDPRGAAQPGERVALFSGLGGQGGSVRALLGTITTSTPTAAWLLMDDSFEPGGMSGSPVLSAYTGRVVGMAVAATRQRGRLFIGLNPIGAIVQHAMEARDFPPISSLTR
jgi:hypothetical protein